MACFFGNTTRACRKAVALYHITNRYSGRSFGFSSGGNPTPSPRGDCTGWSFGAAKRNAEYLQSLDVGAIASYCVFALSLTVRDFPPSAVAFHLIRCNYIRRLRRMSGFRFCHWVIEWQRRGAPHIHMAVAFDSVAAGAAARPLLLDGWLSVASVYRPLPVGQHITPMNGARGWFEYLAKHAARGVRHYQRSTITPGWLKSGRVWGHCGDAPVAPVWDCHLTPPDYFAMRRLYKRGWRASLRARRLDVWPADGRARVAWLAEKRALNNMTRPVPMDGIDDLRVLSRLRGHSAWYYRGLSRDGFARMCDFARDSGLCGRAGDDLLALRARAERVFQARHGFRARRDLAARRARAYAARRARANSGVGVVARCGADRIAIMSPPPAPAPAPVCCGW